MSKESEKLTCVFCKWYNSKPVLQQQRLIYAQLFLKHQSDNICELFEDDYYNCSCFCCFHILVCSRE